MRKLTKNEMFLISFIIVLLLAIALNWKSFSARIKQVFEKYTIEQTQTK